jgi:hypothetical protein
VIRSEHCKQALISPSREHTDDAEPTHISHQTEEASKRQLLCYFESSMGLPSIVE